MPNPVFPTNLPGVLTTQYSFVAKPMTVRTEFESGYARVRRKTMRTPFEVEVSWRFTPFQLAVFEQFYDVDLMGGIAWFDIKLFTGLGESTHVARFKERYRVETIAREKAWSVTATLEVVEWKTLTDPEVTTLVSQLA